MKTIVTLPHRLVAVAVRYDTNYSTNTPNAFTTDRLWSVKTPEIDLYLDEHGLREKAWVIITNDASFGLMFDDEADAAQFKLTML